LRLASDDMLIGVDCHPSFRPIAVLKKRPVRVVNGSYTTAMEKAERFYRDLKQRGIRVRVGMEAAGYSRWFERLLAELGIQIWMGDPAEIKAKRVKNRKTDQARPLFGVSGEVRSKSV
jgi:transposase